MAALSCFCGRVAAQEPPDSLPPSPDSLAADSLAADSLLSTPLPDSLQVPDSTAADSLPPPPVLPTMSAPLSGVSAPGVWEWDRDALTGRRGHSVWELLTEIPGVLAIRSGDFGSPAAAFPMGYAGGGLKVYFDGVEQLPMEGSIPDLARVPISGLERIRVIRRATGLEVHLDRLVHRDPRAFSTIEAGTGDLDTNILRASFSLARALGGKASFALERLDTRGRDQDQAGAITGALVRYSLHRGDQGGIRFEMRRLKTDRTSALVTPTSVQRNDWTFQGLWAFTDRFHLNAWATGASLAATDSTETLPIRSPTRRQFGTTLKAETGGFRAQGTTRFNTGTGVPERELSAEVSWTTPQGHGASLSTWTEAWDGRSGSGVDARAWLSPFPAVTLFAEVGSGDRAVPFVPMTATGSALDSLLMNLSFTDPDPRFTHRQAARLGAEVNWRRLSLRGALVTSEADSVWPTELPFDLGGPAVPQLSRNGWELEGRVPLWPDGLSLKGGMQQWEKTDSATAVYFPDHWYHGGFSFHNVYLPTGNFELWVDLGAQGRPEMTVPTRFDPALSATPVTAQVPFYQNWFFRLQMRIVSVNIFATIENLSLRTENQDVPGGLLPRTRGLYGVRWNLWN